MAIKSLSVRAGVAGPFRHVQAGYNLVTINVLLECISRVSQSACETQGEEGPLSCGGMPWRTHYKVLEGDLLDVGLMARRSVAPCHLQAGRRRLADHV